MSVRNDSYYMIDFFDTDKNRWVTLGTYLDKEVAINNATMKSKKSFVDCRVVMITETFQETLYEDFDTNEEVLCDELLDVVEEVVHEVRCNS